LARSEERKGISGIQDTKIMGDAELKNANGENNIFNYYGGQEDLRI